MSITTIIWLIPLPPLVAFFLIVLFTNKSNKISTYIGVGAAFLSWLAGNFVAFQAFFNHDLAEEPYMSAIEWLPLEVPLEIGVMVDPLSAMVLFFVSWTVFMIFLYSVGYHNFGQPKGDHDHKGLPPHGATVEENGHKHTVPSVEPMYARFFAFIGLFAFGMFTLVLSDNLLTLFVGWEIMGLCSYLLIGFWYGKQSARDAGMKAFMTTRIGDVFMLLGIAYLFSETGTLSFRAIMFADHGHMLADLASTASMVPGLSAAGLIGLLLFIGAVGKSAQFPLHVWLPDAMEGPTPVSAMIHAATMVSAGVYMVIRIYPILEAGGHEFWYSPLNLMAIIGAFTAIFSATIAVAQNDVKRVLAYSTISQLGFMIAALGIGAYVAAVFHLVTHAFFKALLFLGSGSVIHGVEHGVYHTGNHDVDPQDMYNMGGLRKKMPKTFWTFLLGGLALSGFPILTAGFWSKDEILADAWAHGHTVVFWTLAIAAFLTAFYTMRQITLTFLGEARTKEAEHAHETPWTMTVPLIVLAVFAVGFGWVGIPDDFPVIRNIISAELLPNWFHHFVLHGLPHELIPEEGFHFNAVPLLVSFAVALGGLLVGYLSYRNVKTAEEDPIKKFAPALHKVLANKYYFDELYDYIFIQPSKWFAEKFAYLFIDRKVIDGFIHAVAQTAYWLGGFFRQYIDINIVNWAGDATADLAHWFGKQLRKIQTGSVQQYMAVTMLLAFGSFLFYLIVLQ